MSMCVEQDAGEEDGGDTWAHVVWLPSTADASGPAGLVPPGPSDRVQCFCLLIYSGLLGLGLPASTLHVCQELDTRGDTERTKARSLPLSTRGHSALTRDPLVWSAGSQPGPGARLLAGDPSQPCCLAGVCLGLSNSQQTRL